MEIIKFSKSDNRKVLASMNQMLPYIHSGMEQGIDLIEINHRLNDIIQDKLELKIPRKQFELLLSKYI